MARGGTSYGIKTLALLAAISSSFFFLLGWWMQAQPSPSEPFLQPWDASAAALPRNPNLDSFLERCGGRGQRATRHVATDKEQYRPGDTLYARITSFDAVSRARQSAGYSFYNIVGPKGDVVADGYANAAGFEDSDALGMRWVLPTSLPGGEYTIKLPCDDRSAPAERRVTVRSYRAPRLRLRAETLRDSYGFGETADASVSVERAEGGVPTGASVAVVARIDGAEVYRSPEGGAGDLKVPASGELVVSVPLPLAWISGVGTLTVIITDGGTVESTTATLPLIAAALDLRAYPESGDLVAGLPSRVYLEAFLPSGEPADVAANVCARGSIGSGGCVAAVETLHEGRGVSSLFTPRAGIEYELRITQPESLHQVLPLPTPLSEGASLRSLQETFPAGGAVTFELASAKGGLHRVAIYKREVELASVAAILEAGKPVAVALTPAVSPGSEGVLRATLYGPDGRPVAERLVFREPSQQLQLSLSAAAVTSQLSPTKEQKQDEDPSPPSPFVGPACDGSQDAPCIFAPAGRVRLTVEATHHDGHPAAGAEVGITVVDGRALAQAGPRRREHPRLPAMVLLETDVRELMDPGAYLPPPKLPRGPAAGAKDTAEDTAAVPATVPAARRAGPATALDLLLGTQGWRRFAYLDPLEFLKAGNGSDSGGLAAVPQEVWQRVMGVGECHEHDDIGRFGFRTYKFASTAQLQAAAAAAGAAEDGEFVHAAEPAAPEMLADSTFELNSVAAGETSRTADMAMDEAPLGEAPFMDEQQLLEQQMVEPQMGEPQMVAPQMVELVEPLFAKRQVEWVGESFGYMPRDPWERYRRYAHVSKAPQEGTAGEQQQRQDFTETVLFATAIRLDKDGRAQVEFDLSDSVTTFLARADGSSRQGALGAADLPLLSARPLFLEAKLPPQVSSGDVILLPVTAVVAGAGGGSGRGGTAGAPEPRHVSAAAQLAGPLALVAPGSVEEQLLAGLRGSAVGDGAAGASWGVAAAGSGGGGGGDSPRYTVSWEQSRVSERALLPLVATGAGATAAAVANVSLEGALSAGANGAAAAKDSVRQSIRVVPAGFPVEIATGGLLTPAAPAVNGNVNGNVNSLAFTLPGDVLPGSLRLVAMVYSSPLASLAAALERLIQQPCGCFEQTSATTYPMAMALSYMEAHPTESSSELRTRARKLLGDGYKRLVGYESPGGGFDWFGRAPAHEALTAYGILQFLDMQKVIGVDPDVIKRTTEWILSRRDGRGGFLRNAEVLDGFGGAPADVTDAYVLYSLVSAGLEGLQPEIDALEGRVTAEGFDDAYVLGLAAATMGAAGRRDMHASLAKRLLRYQDADGRVAGAATSITNSRGRSLEVETTAIGVLAWLDGNLPEFVAPAETAVRWLASACDDGRFGSTQGTVLALKAILAYEASRSKVLPPSVVTLKLEAEEEKDGSLPFPPRTVELVLDTAKLEESSGRPVAIPTEALTAGLEEGVAYRVSVVQRLLSPQEAGKDGGSSTVGESDDGERPLPYSLLLAWRSPTPQSSAESAVEMETALAGGSGFQRKGVGPEAPLAVAEGESVDILVTVRSVKDEKTGMVVAVVGVPGGLEVRHERLRELREAKKIAFYEVNDGGDVVLYWDGFLPRETKSLSFDASASVPGAFRGAASRAFEYYSDEHKWWVQGLQVHVSAAS